EVARIVVRDFGEPVTVLPPQSASFVASMIFDDGVEEVGIGQIGGHMGQPFFRCLPEVDSMITAGTLVTLDGIEYLVPNDSNVIRRRHNLTEIQVNEQ
ncbi:MAG: hypothetical protein L3J63_11765, partial [Geopsychrobacter sp.]|nr:hypothetical protein [Geopsychrobacter sp.]